jgi:ribosomal protein L1
MNEEALNMSLRKFLKVVGVTSQQEIEKAIRAAVADGRLKGAKTVEAQMVLTIGKAGLNHKVDGTIELE